MFKKIPIDTKFYVNKEKGIVVCVKHIGEGIKVCTGKAKHDPNDTNPFNEMVGRDIANARAEIKAQRFIEKFHNYRLRKSLEVVSAINMDVKDAVVRRLNKEHDLEKILKLL